MACHYAIFSALFAPHVGGVETFTANLAGELAREGNAVTVVTSRLSADTPAKKVQPNGVEVWRLPAQALLKGRLPLVRKNLEWRSMMRELAEQGVDRVLVNTRFYPLSLEAVRWADTHELPCVVLDHGSAYLTLGNPVADATIRAYEHTITKHIKTHKPIFAGISKKSCEWLKTFGIETEFVIPNAIDAEAFRDEASGRDFRAELGIDASQKLVVFAGRLEPEKGADKFAQAGVLLGEDYQLVLAGDGSLRATIESLAAPNVHLLGVVSHADLSALLSQADLFCLPSRSEGFGMAFLEAAIWGLPSVLTRVGIAEQLFERHSQLVSYLDVVGASTIATKIKETPHGKSKELAHFTAQLYSWERSVALATEPSLWECRE